MKVLIVDDSVSSRTDLKTIMNWDQYHYELVGEASNGSEAIRMMRQTVPDLVITDMNMPVMNGVRLIEYLKSQYPDIKIIALSAYDDFDYVRQSLKNGAVDYVLKHQLRPDNLLKLLRSVEDQISHDRDKEHPVDRMPSSKNVLRHDFLSMLLDGSITELEDIETGLKELKLPLETTNIMVTVAEIDDYGFIEDRFTPSEADKFTNTFLDISREIMSEWEKSVIVPVSSGQFALIFSLGSVYSKMYIYNRQFNLLNRIRTEIKRFLNITASFGVSSSYPAITDLPAAFREARHMLENKFYKGKNGIYIENAEKLEERFFCLDIQDEKAIYAALRDLDYERVEAHIQHIIDKISELRLRSTSTRVVCAELINILTKVCKENGIEVTRLYNVQDVPYMMIEKYETISDIRDWLIRLYTKLLDLLKELQFNSNVSKSIQMAIAYIQSHYHQDLSLSDVAEHVGISSSYMSRLFKEECGIGFAEYVNRVRIDHAKWFIEHSDDKLSEIVSRVGFNNYNYFFKVFKKMEKITPLEYEKQCRHTGSSGEKKDNE